LLRIKGSHYIYGKSGKNIRLSILIHKNKPLKIGLFNFIITKAELKEEDF
jgi:predicted RNA binding protein YcfA (HicA-like mRNA interferase family)